jgi:hypothetical protein
MPEELAGFWKSEIGVTVGLHRYREPVCSRLLQDAVDDRRNMTRRMDGRIYNAAAAASRAECRDSERGAQEGVDMCIDKCL